MTIILTIDIFCSNVIIGTSRMRGRAKEYQNWMKEGRLSTGEGKVHRMG